MAGTSCGVYAILEAPLPRKLNEWPASIYLPWASFAFFARQPTMGAYKYLRELWNRKQSDVLRFTQRMRAWEFRCPDRPASYHELHMALFLSLSFNAASWSNTRSRPPDSSSVRGIDVGGP